MKNTDCCLALINIISCIVLWICITVIVSILIFKVVDYFKLKAELKHKMKLEEKRLESREKDAEFTKTKHEIEDEITAKFEKDLEGIVSKKLDKSLCERIKNIEGQLNKK